ncbi:MAG TPA: sigma-54-dependent Fis family transcriptional regulator [Candidatus Binatia bacterium]|jgi:Nif-specific regulatory protein
MAAEARDDGDAFPGEAALDALLAQCKGITSSDEVFPALEMIALKTKEIIKADRVSIFLLDRMACELRSFLSEEKRVMRLDARLGIAGSVAMSGQAINVADAYEHPLFYKEVDAQTGYRTKTLLAVPLKNAAGEIIGVGEAVNKETGLFTDADVEILTALAACVSHVIETVPLAFDSPGKETGTAEETSGFSTQNIIGMGHQIQSIIRLIDQIRGSSVDVLIQGESGTGKELIAKALHFNSPRARKPLVALNCAALPDNLLESELFGIEPGTATGVLRRIGKFEEANGGTLFLDEIGDLTLTAQAKILRALQERVIDRVGGRAAIPIDIRVIAATNKNLEACIREKSFREDLYYRLKVIHIHMPPLREYPPDVPLLANHFLAKYCAAMNTPLKQFTAGALEALPKYAWPGNVRELENEVKRLVASTRSKLITEDDLDAGLRHPADAPAASGTIQQPSPEAPVFLRLPQEVERLERRMITDALRQTGGNKQKAADLLGLSRQGLIKKVKRLSL